MDAPPSDSPDVKSAGLVFADPDAYVDEARWHRAARLLRDRSPVHLVEAEGYPAFYAITRHAHVAELERRNDAFFNTMESVLLPEIDAARRDSLGVELKTLIHMDGAEHRAVRAITNDWFKPAQLRRVAERQVEALAKKHVDRLLAFGGRCDFARDVALFYPLQVIMSILGVPEEDEPRMLRLTQQLFGSEDPEFGGESRGDAMIAALMDFAAYFDKITMDRRANPGPDLASTIANGTIDGEPLGPLETASYYTIVATAGHDTTSSSLITGLQKLIENPDQMELLRSDPDLLPNAVDEIIRIATPVRHFMRHATVEYELDGVALRPGDRLLLSYLSANRDEAVFEEPFRFDIMRPNASDQIAFGMGVHFCLGAHLARMELIAFYRELLARVEDIEFDGEPEYTLATFVGGPKRLPIRYRAKA